MECNKEEAFRAKDIAEKKMQAKDFISARKFALRAQQLYSDVENISQIIMVCDVHCASEKKVAGNEMDWYAILQVEHSADEAMIKKQYRKFALLLHPDKNKFPGAEAAFKLIGEAQRVLLDKEKRHLHNMKRGAFVRQPAPHFRPPQRPPFSQNASVRNNYTYNNSTTGFNPQPQQQVNQPRASNGRKTFWTACPFCNVKYEYYVANMNKSLICQTCKKPFVAYERFAQGVPTVPHRRDVPSQGFTKVELNSSAKYPKAEVFQRKVDSFEVGPQKANGKRRRRKDEESSESSDSESSIEDDDFTAEVDQMSNGEQPRRSDRRRQKISYNENESDDEEFSSPSKKAKEDVKDRNEGKENGGRKNLKNVKGEESAEDGISKSGFDQEQCEYADPDFNDFQEGRGKGCFSVGQLWAMYDTLDAMPRLYARIRKVCSSSDFKVQITWLEPEPSSDDEQEWFTNGWPTSCGQFKDEVSETTSERLMFSHKISFEKCPNGIFKIFPQKGQTWAVIKNWSPEWKSLKKPFEKFEYEFVEIVSDYMEGVGVTVAYLGKLKGFVSVFCRITKEGNATVEIPRGELFRFSHMIPSFQLTDREKQGVPIGSFELDPASLPRNIEEVNAPEGFKVKIDETKAVTDHVDVKTKAEVASDDENDPSESNQDNIEIPEAEFFDFDGQKSLDKFEVGQIWSLYCDEDGLPKYYAEITKVASPGEAFKVRLRWLDSAGLPDNAIQWKDELMPVCCGRYKPRKGGQNFTAKDPFCHRLAADSTEKKLEFAVMPKKGQIWGLYRNWKPEMRVSDLKSCEYDVVEVVEETGDWIEVEYLEQVAGFNSVFKAQTKEGLPVRKKIPVLEILRFSHQIPAFKLTEEKDGSLRGFWELDPAALPVYYFQN